MNRNKTVWSLWRQNAETFPDREAIVHWSVGEEPIRWKWFDLINKARSFGRRLYENGIRQGEVCALIIRHNPDFYPLYMGIVAIGAIPAVLAYPNPRLHPDKFKAGLRGMSVHSGLDWILTESELAPQIRSLACEEGTTVRAILTPLENLERLEEPDIPEVAVSADQVCLLQHSSGTTGLQKAVALSHRTVIAHLENLAAAIKLESSDKIVSWLPLYHDMGLISSFHVPLGSNVPLVQMDPFEWVLAPSTLWEVIHEERGAVLWMPNFAFNILADRTREEDIEGFRFDSVRMLINCSEPVRKESIDRFLTRFAAYGIRPESMAASYAMAEVTFAATQTVPGKPPTILAVDRNVLAGGYAVPPNSDSPVRHCVSSGIPIPGCDLQIIDEQGNVLGEDRVGEIQIASESMFTGYRNRPDLTAEVLQKDWYASGDFGFVHDGEYYVIGRKKDLIIVAGKNLYPEDIEDAVSGIAGVLAGRVIAFGYEDIDLGTERVALVAETALTDRSELEKLIREIVETVMALDITLSKVILVVPRWLVKSSAGKPSRSATQARIAGNADNTGILLIQTFGNGGD